MKDFLNDLIQQDELRKNPLKAFAAFTAYKFETMDENNKELKDIVEKLQKDYIAFKAKMLVYVAVGTIVFNVIIAVLIKLIWT